MKEPKRTYLLVHGAWSGGWAWQGTLARLRARGHTATAPTLSGLGEYRNVNHDTVNLDSHIDNITTHIELEDLHDVTLVGWSYGGAVTTGVLARMPERIGRMIYLDAFVPENGAATVDYLSPAGQAANDRFKERNESLPPRSLALHGVNDPALIKRIGPRLTPQPWRTFYQPVKTLMQWPSIPISYVALTAYEPSVFDATLHRMEKDPNVKVTRLAASHYCMLTAPDETIDLLTSD